MFLIVPIIVMIIASLLMIKINKIYQFNTILSLACLLISLKLYWSSGIYIDNHHISKFDFYSQNYWVYWDWLRIGFIGMIFILSIYLSIKKGNVLYYFNKR